MIQQGLIAQASWKTNETVEPVKRLLFLRGYRCLQNFLRKIMTIVIYLRS